MSGVCGHHETVTGEFQTRSSDDVSSAERGKQLCDHVYLFHEPEGQPELEIVFIHGLHKLGDSFENAYFTTWLVKSGHPANCWPMTWLVDKFPTARILSISYDSSLFRTPTSGNVDLHQLGQTLIKEMVTFSGIGQKGCPLVFVCHSLGGLIAKKIAVMADKDFREDKKVSRLLGNIKAFFFYATPHAGSELVSQMASQNPFRETSPLADNLKPDCPMRARLNKDFEYIRKKVLSKRLEFYTVAETHDTTLKRFVTGMVAPEGSVRYVDSEHIVFVATDHFDVCKPKTESDTIFLHLIECISKVLDEHKRDRLKILKLPVLVVGVDEKLSVLLRKLKGNKIVGLVGMGGIGKTTLSKSMFHSEQGHYAKTCFLENGNLDKSILELQKELFKELCGETWNDNEGTYRNLIRVQQTIKNYKVLVVIDDPGTEKYLEDLQVPAFEESSSGSKVVITCRRRELLSNFMSHGIMVEVEGLNDDQALKLFSHYAFHGFNDHHEIDGENRSRFQEQAKLIVRACGFSLSEHRRNENHHLPLSLEVVGQHLRKQNRHPAEDRMEMWEGALDKLESARAVGGRTDDEKLWKTLRVSYDDLEDWEKSAFLDFACILCDTEDIYASACRRALKADVLQNLIDSSLIKVANGSWKSDPYWKLSTQSNWSHWSTSASGGDRSSESTLWEEICKTSYSGLGDIDEVLIMHNQLRDMGRRIVADSDKMTRIWKDHDVQEFVEKNKSLETLEGLSLVANGQSGSSLASAIISQGIQKHLELPKLRLLNLSNTTQGIVENFMKSCALTPSRLIWLRLSNMASTPCVDTLCAFTGLKVLHISSMSLDSLDDLDDVRIEIGGLTSLLELRLEGNIYLRSLPTTIGSLKELQILVIQDGFRMGELPRSIGDLGNLVELHLLWCRGLQSLPSELHGLTRLKVLNLTGCNELETIPSLGKLTNLKRILLGWCTSLLTLEFGTRMVNLQELILESCRKLESLNSLSNLDRLRTLDLEDCRALCIPNLPECLSHLSQLQNLNLMNCERLAETLRKGHLCTAQLVVLHLSAVPDVGLPRCTRLKLLNLYSKQEARQIMDNMPEPTFSCGPLENVMQNLQVLSLTGFNVHESLGMLVELQELYVERVPELPDSVGKLKKLKILRIKGILSERLPEQIGQLSSLHTLAIGSCIALVELPSSLDRLPQLRTLEVTNCPELGPLPESLHHLITSEFAENYLLFSKID